jgi:hypothetical protein
MPGSSQAAPAAPPESDGATPHDRAGIWIFILDERQQSCTRWYWSHGSGLGATSDAGFASFDRCVADAREQGFDFEQPYHVTAAS